MEEVLPAFNDFSADLLDQDNAASLGQCGSEFEKLPASQSSPCNIASSTEESAASDAEGTDKSTVEMKETETPSDVSTRQNKEEMANGTRDVPTTQLPMTDCTESSDKVEIKSRVSSVDSESCDTGRTTESDQSRSSDDPSKESLLLSIATMNKSLPVNVSSLESNVAKGSTSISFIEKDQLVGVSSVELFLFFCFFSWNVFVVVWWFCQKLLSKRPVCLFACFSPCVMIRTEMLTISLVYLDFIHTTGFGPKEEAHLCHVP